MISHRFLTLTQSFSKTSTLVQIRRLTRSLTMSSTTRPEDSIDTVEKMTGSLDTKLKPNEPAKKKEKKERLLLKTAKVRLVRPWPSLMIILTGYARLWPWGDVLSRIHRKNSQRFLRVLWRGLSRYAGLREKGYTDRKIRRRRQAHLRSYGSRWRAACLTLRSYRTCSSLTPLAHTQKTLTRYRWPDT